MTCARCEALEAELRILRQVAGAKELRTARLMQWWDLGETPVRIALSLYDRQEPATLLQLSDCLKKARTRGRAVRAHVFNLRQKMDEGAIATLEAGGGYQLTEVGRTEIQRALATPASPPAH